MPLDYSVVEGKRLRVIIDTDAACEADDPFAIAHAIMCPKFEVKAIFAEHFGQAGSMRRSYDEIMRVLDAMDKDVPVFEGEEARLSALGPAGLSPASEFLIHEALSDDPKPLFVLCLGAITNIATALRRNLDISKRMTVIWIGGHGPDVAKPDHREFNSGNDPDAANLVMGSGAEFWQVPNDVYGSMQIGLAEIQRRIYPCGKIGRHLFENMREYNMSEGAWWTAGETWALGDSPAVGLAMQPNCGRYERREAPLFNEDTSIRREPGRPLIRVYRSIDSRFILEDFICKLELLYGEG